MTFTEIPADLAITNVPIDMRGGGNLDRQIDRWKREKRIAHRREARANAAERRENKRLAKAALAQHLDAIIAHHGPRFGERALRNMLTGWSKWEPAKLLAFVGKFLRQTKGSSPRCVLAKASTAARDPDRSPAYRGRGTREVPAARLASRPVAVCNHHGVAAKTRVVICNSDDGHDHEITWGEFCRDNVDGLELLGELALVAAAVASGETYRGGGGAEPLWTIRRA